MQSPRTTGSRAFVFIAELNPPINEDIDFCFQMNGNCCDGGDGCCCRDAWPCVSTCAPVYVRFMYYDYPYFG